MTRGLYVPVTAEDQRPGSRNGRKARRILLTQALVEVECSVNCRGKGGFLRRQQGADLTAQRVLGDCHDVVAADNAGVIEAVCRSYRDFG